MFPRSKAEAFAPRSSLRMIVCFAASSGAAIARWKISPSLLLVSQEHAEVIVQAKPAPSPSVKRLANPSNLPTSKWFLAYLRQSCSHDERCCHHQPKKAMPGVSDCP